MRAESPEPNQSRVFIIAEAGVRGFTGFGNPGWLVMSGQKRIGVCRAQGYVVISLMVGTLSIFPLDVDRPICDFSWNQVFPLIINRDLGLLSDWFLLTLSWQQCSQAVLGPTV